MNLKKHEEMALIFLSKGPHSIGVIDTEEKLAACVVFNDLKNTGYVESLVSSGEIIFKLSLTGVEYVLEISTKSVKCS